MPIYRFFSYLFITPGFCSDSGLQLFVYVLFVFLAYVFIFVFVCLFNCLIIYSFIVVVCGWLVKHKVKMPLSLH